MKEKFLNILQSNVHRDGINNLINYINNSDFFTAPCSTKYHLCVEGGLLKHSLNVYENLKKINESFNLDLNEESIVICGLLHDICKTWYYKRRADGTYYVDDMFPVGHGEKSVIILQNFISLTNEEIFAIRWHMNGFDTAVKGGEFAINQALKNSPLVTALQCADMISTCITEAD